MCDQKKSKVAMSLILVRRAPDSKVKKAHWRLLTPVETWRKVGGARQNDVGGQVVGSLAEWDDEPWMMQHRMTGMGLGYRSSIMRQYIGTGYS